MSYPLHVIPAIISVCFFQCGLFVEISQLFRPLLQCFRTAKVSMIDPCSDDNLLVFHCHCSWNRTGKGRGMYEARKGPAVSM